MTKRDYGGGGTVSNLFASPTDLGEDEIRPLLTWTINPSRSGSALTPPNLHSVGEIYKIPSIAGKHGRPFNVFLRT